MATINKNMPNLSAGVSYLGQGYIDYALAVITDRALPDIRDGLKPVQRRVVQVLHERAANALAKSQTIAGETLKLSPHTDTAVYAAAVLMTHVYNSSALALIYGSGSFGNASTTDKPAAPRYTEMKLAPIGAEFFNETDGVKTIPSYDGKYTELEVLPAPFPYVLLRPSSGIAVGFATNTPGFNFVDICNLVKEYIAEGTCKTVIYPDFATGGYYIKDDAEMQKLMLSGKARLKLRGKYKVLGNNYVEICDLPYGKTVQGLLKQINQEDKAFSPYIAEAMDGVDAKHPHSLNIKLRGKTTNVDDVMYLLSKYTDFQAYMPANITVLDNGVPKQLGVWQIIKKWVSWRKSVIVESYRKKIPSLKQSVAESLAFMEVVKDRAKCLELVNIIAKEGKDAGYRYVQANFTREQVPFDQINFVCSRSVNAYKDGGVYKTQADNCLAKIQAYEKIIADPATYISQQMDTLISKYGRECPRCTEVIDTDYDFSKDNAIEAKQKEANEVKSGRIYNFNISNTHFISINRVKMQDTVHTVEASMGDTLLMFDNIGQILRVYLSDVDFNSTPMGAYLPRYFGFDAPEGYRITYVTKLEPKRLFLIYRDGNIGFVDTTEWTGNTRKVKVLQKGINESSAYCLGAVLEDTPQVLYVADENGNFAWVNVNDLPRKSRTGKTRAFAMKRDRYLHSYSYANNMVELAVLPNNSNYCGKLGKLPDSVDVIDVDSFTEFK